MTLILVLLGIFVVIGLVGRSIEQRNLLVSGSVASFVSIIWLTNWL